MLQASVLRNYRNRKNMTQPILGIKIGLGKGKAWLISSWELRKEPIPDEYIDPIAKVLGLTEEEKTILQKEYKSTKDSISRKKRNGSSKKTTTKNTSRKKAGVEVEEKARPNLQMNEESGKLNGEITIKGLENILKIIKDSGGSIPKKVFMALLKNT